MALKLAHKNIPVKVQVNPKAIHSSIFPFALEHTASDKPVHAIPMHLQNRINLRLRCTATPTAAVSPYPAATLLRMSHHLYP